MGSNPVPAFLTKLWTLVENPQCDDLICWDVSGKSFHVFDQGRFAKEVLPLYFKHSNIASFIRQLNMYGFRKVANIEQGLKTEKDDVEFQHPYFQRGQEHLLEHIKRKITQHIPMTQIKVEPVQTIDLPSHDISKMVTEVSQVRGRQDVMNSKLDAMKRENEVLWREVASLRQKHMKQTQIVNKLIQFLVHLVGANRVSAGNKRKLPLMISDSPSPKVTRYTKGLPLDLDSAYTVQSPDSQTSGPIIHDVTDADIINVPVTSKTSTATTSSSKPAEKFDIAHLSLPSDLMNAPSLPAEELKTEEMNLFNNFILPEATVDLPGSLPNVISMSDLSSLLPKSTIPSSTDTQSLPQPSLSLSKQQFKGFDRQKSVSEMSDHVDTVQSDLDGLRDLLSGTNCLDTSTLLGLFNADGANSLSAGDSILSGLDGMKTDDARKTGQVVQYKSSEDDIPDLFDLAAMSKDYEEEEEDPLSESDVNRYKSGSLDTPLPIQISADDLD